MARTRTPGIRMDRNGGRIIDKEHRGKGIYLRLGPISQEHAEQRLADEIARAMPSLSATRARVQDSRTAPHASSSSRRTNARSVLLRGMSDYLLLISATLTYTGSTTARWRPLSLTDWRQASRLRQLTAAWKSCVPY
jgi:hypothetical protein